MKTTVVNLVLDAMLPQELRDPTRSLDKDGVDNLMLQLAKDHPAVYPKVALFLSEAGANLAFKRGETFGIEDFRAPASRALALAQLREEQDRLDNTVMSASDKSDARGALFAKYSDRIANETSKESVAARNNIAMTVMSGARGKKPQLRDLISTPGYYLDHDKKAIPWFIERSFAEGLSVADFLAGSYAARESVTEAKKAVAKGGFLSKTLARTNYRNYVTIDDCGTSNGIDLPAEEKDLRGRVLQQPVGEVGQGSVITRGVFNAIKKTGKPVLVRSALTCEAPEGVCSKCYGVTAEGRFPSVGDHVGITASNALGEPLAQGALNQKHVTSASGPKKDFSGLDYLFQFTESPEEFKDKAPVSPVEGSVTGVREAAQGGSYVSINGADEVYIPLERTLSVKVGDSVEAGDALSDGLVDPEDILLHKGLGEGRRYYAEKLNDIATASGAGMDRRHFEVLARKAIDHVELDDPEEEGFLPSDLVSYESFMHKRRLPADLKQTKPSDAVGKYLQQPSLHYSVGTRITPRVAKRLTDQGIGSIATSASEPGFKPVMLRLQQAASFDDDWLARMGGSYLTRNLEDSKTRALDTNIETNSHPVPRLAVGVGYGDKLDKGKGF